MCCDVLRDGKKSTLNEIERREGIQRCTTVVGRATHHTMLRTVGEEGLQLLAEAGEGKGGAFRRSLRSAVAAGRGGRSVGSPHAAAGRGGRSVPSLITVIIAASLSGGR